MLDWVMGILANRLDEKKEIRTMLEIALFFALVAFVVLFIANWIGDA